MTVDLLIGIDYSGREAPTSRTPTLQVSLRLFCIVLSVTITLYYAC